MILKLDLIKLSQALTTLLSANPLPPRIFKHRSIRNNPYTIIVNLIEDPLLYDVFQGRIVRFGYLMGVFYAGFVFEFGVD